MAEPLPPNPSGAGVPPPSRPETPAGSEFHPVVVSDAGSQPPGPAPAKAKWPLSRTILLVILAICLAMLGFDLLHGRYAQQNAFELLKSKLPKETNPEKVTALIIKDEPLTVEEVHKIMGRDPDISENNPKKAAIMMRDVEGEAVGVPSQPDMVEVYRYAGALRSYVVRVAYRKASDAKGAPVYFINDLNAGTESLFGSKVE
jgi:hypothetical protein